MPSLEPVIRKLFEECDTGNDIVDCNMEVRSVLEYCESKHTFTKHDHDLFAFVKCKKDDGIEYIRMICLVKLSKKKVDNVGSIMAVIRCIEHVLVFIDSCDASESDGFMYLDITKELKPKSN
jgi:hypothetical protein